jgi:WD40 repeat protein
MRLFHNLDGIGRCAISPDGRAVAVPCHNKTIVVVSQTGEWVEGERTWVPAATLTAHDDVVNACAFSPDGRLLASTSDDRTVRLWSPTAGGYDAAVVLGTQDDATTVCVFSPDGRRLLSLHGAEATVWDVPTRSLHANLRGHRGRASACAWSPDGRWIVTAADDATLKLWNAADGAPVWEYRTGAAIQAAAWSADGSRVLAGTIHGELHMLQPRNLSMGPPLLSGRRRRPRTM